MYSKCKRMVGLLLICVLALGVSAAAFETQIEPRDNWHDYTGELPADTGDVEVSTVKKAYTNNYFAVSCKSSRSGLGSVNVWTETGWGVNASSPNHPITANGIINNVNYTNKPSIQTEVTLNIDNNSITSTTYPIEGRWSPY